MAVLLVYEIAFGYRMYISARAFATIQVVHIISLILQVNQQLRRTGIHGLEEFSFFVF